MRFLFPLSLLVACGGEVTPFGDDDTARQDTSEAEADTDMDSE